MHKVEDAVKRGGTCRLEVRGAPNAGTQRTVGLGGSRRACHVPTPGPTQSLGHAGG